MKPGKDTSETRAEQNAASLQVNEHGQKAAVEQAFLQDTNGKAIIDENCCWLTYNDAYAREFHNLFGIEPSPGSSLRDLTPTNNESYELIIQDLEKVLESNVSLHRSIRQPFSAATITFYYQPILLEKGQKALSIQSFKGLDEQIRPEPFHKLQDFTDLANLIPHIFWVADEQGQIQFINNSWAIYTGEKEEALLAQSNSRAVHEEDRTELWNRWNQAVASHSPYEAEFRLKNKQGQYRWFVSRARAIKDRRDKVLRWVGISMDVHDYKEMEQTLKQQQGFLRALADNVPAFILSLDEQGHIRFANTFHKKLGFKPDELIGQPFYTAYTLKDVTYAQALYQGIKKALQGSEERIMGRIYDTNGETIEVETVVYPYRSDFLQPKGVILLSFDVTLHKKEQENLQNQKKQLQEVNQDFDILFHRMAHDIYGPLNSLEGLFQLLLAEPGLAKSQKPLLRHMETSLKKFRDTLGHIISWVAASANSSTQREQTNLVDLMKELIWDMQETISQTDTNIETVYNKSCFEMSSRNLRSILYNIISNSIKYRRNRVPPKIKVTFFETSAFECCIEIQDNGLGIKNSELSKVTEAFEKLDPGSHGLGLGMYVVKRIVERYQGSIEIESVAGEGTTLRLFLCPR